MTDNQHQVQVFTRMQSDVYKRFEDSLIQPYVQTSTTDQQVAFALGIQYVLKRLRDGFVVPS